MIHEYPVIGEINLAQGEDGSMMGTPGAGMKITVEYFGQGYGRSSPVRFLLNHAKCDFEYIGYDFPTWGKIKGEGKGGEFGGLPRVTINGQEFGQSMASLRMLGTKLGYYDPTDWKAAFYCDVVLDAWVDVLGSTTGIMLSGAAPEE